jgi:hypothetical protein
MNPKDARGYYKTLGVDVNASPSVIKAAYRTLAMELHPDRNPTTDTTAKFQDLQEAYAVLSDENLRQQYDADNSIPSAANDSSEGVYRPFEPIVCSRCNAVTAQPRFKVFYTVYGYVFGATRTPQQGIFCSKCEMKVGLKSSAITLVAGWWSIGGFVWTLHTLLHNLTGGRFYLQNAQLQGYQAMYFAQNGKLELARAVAIEALKIAEKASKSTDDQSARRKNLGYQSTDPLADLKINLRNFLDTFSGDSTSIELKAQNIIFNKRFLYQSILLIVFFGSIAGESYRRDIVAEKEEQARLIQQGIEREKAAAIAAKEAEVLKSMERPLPPNGYSKTADKRQYSRNQFPALKINNSPDGHTWLKLVKVSDGTEVMSLFIRAGQSAEVAVPFGSFKARIASGQTWYGESIRFGPNTSYATLDAVLDFKLEGNQLVGHELTLSKIKNGNLKQVPLTANDF